MKFSRKAVVGIIAALGAAAALAQQPGIVRVPLQDQPLSDPARHVVQARAEFDSGVVAGRHTHPGEEIGYLLEGTILLEVDGQPPRTLNAGESFFIPAGVVHGGKNIGAGVAKIVSTYIVEIGKPVASPVK